MTIVEFTEILGFCVLINFAILLAWVLIINQFGNAIEDILVKLFQISGSDFISTNYCAYALYKVFSVVFFLVPYLALNIFTGLGFFS